jgi:hypothetical protein
MREVWKVVLVLEAGAEDDVCGGGVEDEEDGEEEVEFALALLDDGGGCVELGVVEDEEGGVGDETDEGALLDDVGPVVADRAEVVDVSTVDDDDDDEEAAGDEERAPGDKDTDDDMKECEVGEQVGAQVARKRRGSGENGTQRSDDRGKSSMIDVVSIKTSWVRITRL